VTTSAVSRRPVVYLIAQPTVARNKKPLDLAQLYDHGEVQVLCPQGDSPTFKPAACFNVMCDRFKDFDPDVDFLVWAGGDTLSAVMAGMLLVEQGYWYFQWLRFDRDRERGSGRRLDTGKYVPVTVDLCDEDYTYDPDDETQNPSLEQEPVP
jgi:hypothetical protein